MGFIKMEIIRKSRVLAREGHKRVRREQEKWKERERSQRFVDNLFHYFYCYSSKKFSIVLINYIVNN